ncbi:MAG: MFS transporter [Candidatus Bathyarchaeia archaeon]
MSPASERRDSWCYAYLSHSVASSIMSVLIPLYLFDFLGGSLFDLGVMIALATLLRVPVSILGVQLPERFGKLKPFMMISFLSSGLMLFLLAGTRDILLFQIFYILLSPLDSVHPASKSVLVAESYQRKGWEAALARYNFMEGAASALGLALCGAFIAGVGYPGMLKICGLLILTSLLLTPIFVRDPPLYVERWLARIERPVDEANTLSHYMGFSGLQSRIRRVHSEKPRMGHFCFGHMAFSFAASCAFTSLPIYLYKMALIPTSKVFTVFLSRSISGALSYPIVGRLIGGGGDKGAVKAGAGLRIFLSLFTPSIALVSLSLSPLISIIILSLAAFSRALYSVGSNTLVLEYASEDTQGIYMALGGLGAAIGGFFGGIIASVYGFDSMFMASAIIFILAFLLFRRGLRD